MISTRAALLLVVMLTACTAASGPDPAPTSPAPTSPAPASPSPAGTASAHPVDGITATVVQYTRDRPERRIQVKLTNTSEHALDVTLLEPRFRGFVAAQPPARTSHLEPDRRVDVPVELGEPSCDAPAGGTSEVVVRGVTAGGVSQQRVVPIDDDDRLIERVQALDCDVARVEAAADLTLADTWERTGSGADAAVTGHVTMALRPGGGSVRVTDLDAGLLLRITSGRPEPDGTDPTYQVDAAQPRTEWDVELVGARCDGHALAESRRLMALTFLVSLDGAEPVRLRRSPDVEGYNTLSAALLERCEHREG